MGAHGVEGCARASRRDVGRNAPGRGNRKVRWGDDAQAETGRGMHEQRALRGVLPLLLLSFLHSLILHPVLPLIVLFVSYSSFCIVSSHFYFLPFSPSRLMQRRSKGRPGCEYIEAAHCEPSPKPPYSDIPILLCCLHLCASSFCLIHFLFCLVHTMRL